MEVKAKLNYLRISPRKVRLVADLIRGLGVQEAQSQLKFLPQRVATSLFKLLNSAVANAHQNFGLEKENLYISRILVNTGPMLKRWRPRSRGMAVPIRKRTSHIELVLETRKEGAIKKVKEREQKEVMVEQPGKEIRAKIRKKKPFNPEKKIKRPGMGGIGQKIFRRKAF